MLLKYVQQNSDRYNVNTTLLTCIVLRPCQQYGVFQKSAAFQEHRWHKDNQTVAREIIIS